MKTTVALLCIFILGIFSDYAQYEIDFDSKESTNQPIPYLHDKDSTLMIYPILENDNMPGDKYIQDIKFIYKDLHYCSDMSSIKIINKDTTFTFLSIKRMSCKISAVIRIDEHQRKIISTVPTQKIIIENLVTDNIYHYDMKDSLYFIKAFKLEDYKKPLQTKKVEFKPKSGGQVK
jgi:hypothetical protein